MSAAAEPLMYREIADWFHLLTSPADYDEEAKLFVRTIREAAGKPVRTVVELGSGGGNNASHMKSAFELTLVDRSPQMLQLSKSLNPECEHVEGDMRTVRLGRTFDAVFVHDACSYLNTRADLLAAMETAAAHLEPGGVALFVPDYTRESFKPTTSHGGHDGDGRALRYLCWIHDPDPGDERYTMSFAYLLKEEGRPVRALTEDHEMGLFPNGVWLDAMRKAGFAARRRPYELSSFDPPITSGLFTGRLRWN